MRQFKTMQLLGILFVVSFAISACTPAASKMPNDTSGANLLSVLPTNPGVTPPGGGNTPPPAATDCSFKDPNNKVTAISADGQNHTVEYNETIVSNTCPVNTTGNVSTVWKTTQVYKCANGNLALQSNTRVQQSQTPNCTAVGGGNPPPPTTTQNITNIESEGITDGSYKYKITGSFSAPSATNTVLSLTTIGINAMIVSVSATLIEVSVPVRSIPDNAVGASSKYTLTIGGVTATAPSNLAFKFDPAIVGIGRAGPTLPGIFSVYGLFGSSPKIRFKCASDVSYSEAEALIIGRTDEQININLSSYLGSSCTFWAHNDLYQGGESAGFVFAVPGAMLSVAVVDTSTLNGYFVFTASGSFDKVPTGASVFCNGQELSVDQNGTPTNSKASYAVSLSAFTSSMIDQICTFQVIASDMKSDLFSFSIPTIVSGLQGKGASPVLYGVFGATPLVSAICFDGMRVVFSGSTVDGQISTDVTINQLNLHLPSSFDAFSTDHPRGYCTIVVQTSNGSAPTSLNYTP